MSPVEVPESLREITLRLFLGRIRQERVLNGNQAQLSGDLRRFLWALAHPEQASDSDDGSANGTPIGDTGSLLLTTQDLAERWGCSTRYARRKAALIGTKVGRQWLVEESDARRSA